MPAKFRPSERVINRVRGQRMNTHSPIKVWKHHYMKCQSKELLFETINSSRTKPKLRIKCINELVRRGVKIDFFTQAEWDIMQQKELV